MKRLKSQSARALSEGVAPGLLSLLQPLRLLLYNIRIKLLQVNNGAHRLRRLLQPLPQHSDQAPGTGTHFHRSVAPGLVMVP
jgi:hypothetical protein